VESALCRAGSYGGLTKQACLSRLGQLLSLLGMATDVGRTVRLAATASVAGVATSTPRPMERRCKGRQPPSTRNRVSAHRPRRFRAAEASCRGHAYQGLPGATSQVLALPGPPGGPALGVQTVGRSVQHASRVIQGCLAQQGSER